MLRTIGRSGSGGSAGCCSASFLRGVCFRDFLPAGAVSAAAAVAAGGVRSLTAALWPEAVRQRLHAKRAPAAAVDGQCCSPVLGRSCCRNSIRSVGQGWCDTGQVFLIAYNNNVLGRGIEACPRGLACLANFERRLVVGEESVAAAANTKHTDVRSDAAL